MGSSRILIRGESGSTERPNESVIQSMREVAEREAFVHLGSRSRGLRRLTIGRLTICSFIWTLSN